MDKLLITYLKLTILFIVSIFFVLTYPHITNAQELIDFKQNYEIFKLNETQNRIIIYGKNQYYKDTDNTYKKITPLKFPTGNIIENIDQIHNIVAIPKWANPSLSPDGSSVDLLDSEGSVIYKFIDPAVSPLASSTEIINVKFAIYGDYIGFDLENLTEPLKIYDDITSGYALADNGIASGGATNNYGNDTEIYIQSKASGIWRSTLQFITPYIDGVISSSSINLYRSYNFASGGSANNIELHELTRSDFQEDEMTWNIYKTGSNWSSSGGDYSATIIDSNTSSADWNHWYINGAAATNPFSFNFGETIEFLLKYDVETDADGAYKSFGFSTKESATNEPTLIIDYTLNEEQTEPTACTRPNDDIPFNNELTVISGYTEIYTTSTTTPDEVRYTWYHVPFIAWIVLGIPLLWIFSRLILEIIIRFRELK